MRTRVVVWSALYYIGVSVLLVGVLLDLWSAVLPKHLAGQIGHNSEGYVAALAIPAWIQFVRPKLTGRRAEWLVTTLVGLAFAALTIWMLASSWASRFRTLNEGILAIALLIPYVQLRRPLPRRVAGWATAVLIIGTIATIRTAFTVEMAETWGMVIFAVIGFDLIDRAILDPAAATSAVTRWIWYAFLVIAPITFSVLESRGHLGAGGVAGGAVRWLVRINESFIYAIFTEVFFAVLLGRTATIASSASRRRNGGSNSEVGEGCTVAVPPELTAPPART